MGKRRASIEGNLATLCSFGVENLAEWVVYILSDARASALTMHPRVQRRAGFLSPLLCLHEAVEEHSRGAAGSRAHWAQPSGQKCICPSCPPTATGYSRCLRVLPLLKEHPPSRDDPRGAEQRYSHHCRTHAGRLRICCPQRKGTLHTTSSTYDRYTGARAWQQGRATNT